jgi:hypothetical protein
MTTTAQYATVPKSGIAQVSTANTNLDGTGTLAIIAAAGATGTRIDGLLIKATGTTTAGMIRFFLTKGRALPVITSITFTGTTAVLTTADAHGLTTGQLVTVVGCRPDEYNVDGVVVTVTGATTFSYVMSVAPTTNAVTLGSASTTLATPSSRLLLEIPVTAATPSGTVTSFVATLGSANSTYKVYFPLVLQAGWTLRASTHNAETFNILPTFAGDFS